MAEWESFRAREQQLNFFTPHHPQGLVCPVRYADGDHFPAAAKNTQCNFDFSQVNYPDQAFRLTPKYLEFDDLLKQVADDLLMRIGQLPVWQADFPSVEPPPLQPIPLSRPVL
jgi:hypothetical protein